MTKSVTYDWQSGKSLSECLDYVFTSCIASDVTFVVGESKKRVQAHKLILLTRSPVFYAMFEGPMAEKGEIIIPDVTEETFSLFLRYLYTDKVNITVVNVVPLMSVARKYCVDVLISLCENFLKEHLNSENACLLLEQSHIFFEDKLQTDCLKIINECSEDILKSGTFKDLCANCVLSIVQSDDLAVEECDVYDAVIRWSDAECVRQSMDVSPENRRNVLGHILLAVRFPIMDKEFFLDKVCNEEVLSPEYIVEVINYQRHSRLRTESKLNVKERKGISEMPERLWRVKNTYTGAWSNDLKPEAISFSSSKTLYLYGIGSYRTGTEPSYISIQIFEGENILCHEKENTLHEIQNNAGDVMLKKRLTILPNKTYTIVEQPSAPKYAYGKSGLNDINFNGSRIVFSSSTKSTYTNVNCGQIPYLLLSKK